MGAEWTRATTPAGKAAIKTALILKCYDSSINYDDFVKFYNLSEDQAKIKEGFQDKQEKYIAAGTDQPGTITQNKNITSLDPETGIQKKDPEKIQEKRKRGRPNKGLTQLHRIENNKIRHAENREIRKAIQPESFNQDIIERVTGEIINDNDLTQFKELYKTTCDSILDNFRENHPELLKLHPYNYFKKILLELKRNTPPTNIEDVEKLFIIWDCLKELMADIGLYITFEVFENITGIYKYQLEDRQKVSPRYGDLLKKISIERDSALISELSYNPYNQTNKIFLAKVHGIIEKTEPKQIEVHHDIRNYNSLPMFNHENE